MVVSRFARTARPPIVDAELRDRLLSEVRRFRPAWMRDREEDLVQDAVVKLLSSAAPIGGSRAFARTVARSIVVDEVRRVGRRPALSTPPDELDRLAPARGSCPEARLVDAQAAGRIRAAVEGLRPDRRAALELWLEGHPVPDIAARLGWPFKRTSNLVYRGLDDLRRALAEDGLAPAG